MADKEAGASAVRLVFCRSDVHRYQTKLKTTKKCERCLAQVLILLGGLSLSVLAARSFAVLAAATCKRGRVAVFEGLHFQVSE